MSIKWHKYITRRISVQISIAWNFGFGVLMRKRYGVSINDILVYRDKKKSEYWVDEKQYEKFINGLYRLLKNKRFLKTFHKQCQHELETIYSQIQKDLKVPHQDYSNTKLVKLFKKIKSFENQYYVRMWIVFCFGDPLSDTVIRALRRYYSTENEIIKNLLIYSAPLLPNDVLNERIELLRLAKVHKKYSKTQFEEKIRGHTLKYRHIPMFDPDHQPYTISHFKKELEQISQPEKELKKLNRLFKGRKNQFNQAIKKIHPDAYTRQLLTFLKEAVFLRDYRDMLRQKSNLALRGMYEEISMRLGLNVEQCCTLSNQEIITYLTQGQHFSKQEVRRRKIFFLIQSKNKIKLISGQKAVQRAKRELRLTASKKTKEIKGIVGSSGIVQGCARIVYTNRDLKKIKPGDIMVATMTRQDFVSYMRRCKAIVTDEGSVTCHAAIIARELKIPCVVGTKISTQVFKDGDKVEVDATNGIIKKLK